LPSSIGEDAVREGMPATLRFEDGREERQLEITHARKQKRLWIVRLPAIETADDAESLVGAELWTARDNVVLAENEYLDDDLIGCAVLQNERTIGSVRAVRHYPAQDMLELDGGALVPLIGAFVRGIDVDARVIRVDLPQGLVEGDAL
jgi:16S rRNA processing protein RimM